MLQRLGDHVGITVAIAPIKSPGAGMAVQMQLSGRLERRNSLSAA
jgi:hypothetical protein